MAAAPEGESKPSGAGSNPASFTFVSSTKPTKKMERYIENLPDYQQRRIRNLAANQGYDDLIAASLTQTPLAKTPDGDEFLFISTATEMPSVELRISSAIFRPDVPVMDKQKMKKLET